MLQGGKSLIKIGSIIYLVRKLFPPWFLKSRDFVTVFCLSTFPTYTGRFFSIWLLDAFRTKVLFVWGENLILFYFIFFKFGKKTWRETRMADLNRLSFVVLTTIDRVIFHNRSNDFLDRLKRSVLFFSFHFLSTLPNKVKNKNKIMSFFRRKGEEKTLFLPPRSIIIFLQIG